MQDSGKINTFFQLSSACYRYDKMFIIVPYMIYILSYMISYHVWQDIPYMWSFHFKENQLKIH